MSRSVWMDDPANFEQMRQNFTTSLAVHGPNMTLPDMSERLCEFRHSLDEAQARIRQLEAERDAAYRRGLEDAAKVADGWADTFAGHEPQHIPAQVYALGAVEDIAVAIRALAK